jgi:hypothetical protein
MLATFTAGSGLDGRGSKRQRMRQPQEEGCSGSYLANPTAGARVYTCICRVGELGWSSVFFDRYVDFTFPICFASHFFPPSPPTSTGSSPSHSFPTTEEEEQVYNQLAPLTESMPIR